MASQIANPEPAITQSTDSDIVVAYRHMKMLGHGNSGAVEEVTDLATGKSYARKTFMLRGSTRKKEEAKRVFHNEVKIILGLGGHHHMIRVHTAYVTFTVLGILLEPVARGGDLEEYLADYEQSLQSTTTQDPRIVAMTAILQKGFGCLAAGLAFMHKQRVRHKDIKLRNILRLWILV
jgi:serine/threonine protein kinase